MDDSGNVLRTFEPSGTIARLSEKVTPVISIDGVPIVKREFGNLQGLPQEQADTMYIVSIVVQDALRGKRSDLLCPTDFVRDEAGRIIGCRALSV